MLDRGEGKSHKTVSRFSLLSTFFFWFRGSCDPCLSWVNIYGCTLSEATGCTLIISFRFTALYAESLTLTPPAIAQNQLV
jgi:hypothetical protein